MQLDRIEESLMAVIALCVLSYLLPFSITRNVIVTAVIAVGLIVLLLLRSVSWHLERITPFDGVLLFGILVTIAYLLSFFAFQQTVLGAALVILFAIYYGLMAFLLARHRGWLFGGAHTVDDADDNRLNDSPVEQRTIRARTQTPVRRMALPFLRAPKERAERNERSDRSVQEGRSVLRQHAVPRKRLHFFHVDKHLDIEHDPAFRRGIEPIPEVRTPTIGKVHGVWFKRGIEPIPEVTKEHLHKLGVYDAEPRMLVKKKRV